MIGGQAVTVLPIMWALVATVFVFIALRLYTRIKILKQLGMDDHIYTLSGALFLLYVIFLHKAAEYGFGQDINTLSIENAVNAVMIEMIGQTFGVLCMAVAKWSLGLFLLRIVVEKWHRVVIWTILISLILVSVMTAILLWVQCLPPSSIWDPRVDGTCIIKITPFSILLGVWCIVADFTLALLPWLFLWPLNMNKNEKLTIAGSMSLGVLAGACGVVRTIELQGFNSSNYTEDTVGLIVWSAAEIAITMVCTGIPVLRPLYGPWIPNPFARFSRNKYRRSIQGEHGDGFTMHTIGGGPMNRRAGDREFAKPSLTSGSRDSKTKAMFPGHENDSDETVLNRPERIGLSSNDGCRRGVPEIGREHVECLGSVYRYEV